jgi:hypothetical protein
MVLLLVILVPPEKIRSLVVLVPAMVLLLVILVAPGKIRSLVVLVPA